jgi:VWFA-related protein
MRFSAKLYCVLLLCGLLPAEQPSHAHPSTLTLKSSSRMVVVDVIVTDKAGNPVRGLRTQDFTVLEDGKPQQLKGFEEHSPELKESKPGPLPSLPANTYTNYVAQKQSGAANVILYDSLNADRQNLGRARDELLRYLSTMPPQSKVALFTLDGNLHLVQGFTEDTAALIVAAKQLSSYPNPTMRKAREVSEDKAMAAEAGMASNPKVYAALVRFLWSEYDGKAEMRTRMTMDALNQLARSLAVVPGRKNLIWISGGIPFDPTTTDPQMQKTAGLLAATQIAVYPVDVRGLSWLGADGATRGSEIGPRGGDYATLSGQAAELDAVHESMFEVARLTGGRAYYNNNDVAGQVNDIVASGSHYYTLAYRPQSSQWDGRFRKVTVKVGRPNAKVQCRPGYYAIADPFGTPDIDRSFSAAMQPTVPPSTSLIIKAQVLPPAEPEKAAQIDFLIDVHDLTLLEADKGDLADVMFVAAAWTNDGKPGGSVTANFRQAMDEGTLKSLMRTGLRLHQEMQLKPGSYQLRLGVVDRLSGKMGTIDVPLKVEAKVARNGTPQF